MILIKKAMMSSSNRSTLKRKEISLKPIKYIASILHYPWLNSKKYLDLLLLIAGNS
jgi:arginine exporter protein ArgO